MNESTPVDRRSAAADGAPSGDAPSPFQGGTYTCDFCGKQVDRVRRIALDRGYDRLGIKHVRQYACSDCSEGKEATRTGSPEAHS